MSPHPGRSEDIDRAALHLAASDLLAQALNHDDPAAWLHAAHVDPSAKSEALRLLSLHLSAGSNFLSAPIESARAAWQPESLIPGTILAGRYRIQRLLGEGGMGEVYLVDDEELHQQVALKTLRPHLAADPSALERFRREVLLLRELHHPNVIRIFDFGRANDTYFYTMEFLEGETLSNRIKSSGPLPEQDVTTLAQNLLSALTAIHTKGIVHRDLKPSNIFLVTGGRIVLMDFGIATTKGKTTLTDANSVLGSLDYMSPEQLEGQDVSPRSDYYSLGLLLHESLTGHQAFSGTSPVARAFRRINEPTAHDTLPGPLGRAIDACLNKDSEARPGSPDYILRLIDGYRPWPLRKFAIFAAVLMLSLTIWQYWPKAVLANPELDQHLKLAAQFASRRTAADLDNARLEFEAALQIDNANPDAWAGLAEVYSTISNFGFGEPRPSLRKARQAAERALELAPDSAAAQAVNAYIVSLDLEKWRTADPLFRRAIELDQTQTRTRLWYGAYLGKLGRFAEALAQLNVGLTHDPGSMPLNHELTSIHTYARNYEAAEAAARKLVRLQPREPSSYLALCRTLLARQKLDDAKSACDEALRQDKSISGQALFASVLAAQGKLGEAKAIARGVESKIRNVSILCDLYHRIGETDRAVALVEKAYAEGDSTIQLIGHSSRFDGVRPHPSVQRIIHALGFLPTPARQITTRGQ